MNQSRSRFVLLAIAASAILMLAFVQPASAGPFSPGNFTFGQFAQVNNANNAFELVNAVSAAAFGAPEPVQVNYTFSAFRTQPVGTFGATLEMIATTNIPAFSAPPLDVQPFNGFDGNEILITSNEPIDGHPSGSLILEVLWDTSTLTGAKGKHSAGMVSQGDVLFSSDFVSFNKTAEQAFALSFTSVNPPIAILGAPGFLRSFTAAGTGTFSLTVTPEPASVVLLMIGLALSVVIWRRQTAIGTPA